MLLFGGEQHLCCVGELSLWSTVVSCCWLTKLMTLRSWSRGSSVSVGGLHYGDSSLQSLRLPQLSYYCDFDHGIAHYSDSDQGIAQYSDSDHGIAQYSDSDQGIAQYSDSDQGTAQTVL